MGTPLSRVRGERLTRGLAGPAAPRPIAQQRGYAAQT